MYVYFFFFKITTFHIYFNIFNQLTKDLISSPFKFTGVSSLTSIDFVADLEGASLQTNSLFTESQKLR